MKFTANINRFEDASYIHFYIEIPETIFNEIKKTANEKRIICTLNSNIIFHCAMIPNKTFHYLMLNQEICKKNNFQFNDCINVEILPDNSKYGMEVCEEFEEILATDDDGNFWFEKLTNGKKRSLLYMINKIKNSQTRIEKTFVILDHLKRNKGTLDFKLLNEDFKNYNRESLKTH